MNNQYNFQRQQTLNYNNIVWVIGVEGARAYQIPPNTNVLMLDSENEGIMYIKTSDSIGLCNLRLFKFEEVTDAPKPQNNYVTKEELEAELSKLRGGLANEQTIPAAKPEQRDNKPKAIITE